MSALDRDAREPSYHWLELAQHRAEYTHQADGDSVVVSHRYARLFHRSAAELGSAPLINCANAVSHGVTLACRANGDVSHEMLAPTDSVMDFAFCRYDPVAMLRFVPHLFQGHVRLRPLPGYWPTLITSQYPRIRRNDWIEAQIYDVQPDGSTTYSGYVHHVGAMVDAAGSDSESFWGTLVASMDRASAFARRPR